MVTSRMVVLKAGEERMEVCAATLKNRKVGLQGRDAEATSGAPNCLF